MKRPTAEAGANQQNAGKIRTKKTAAKATSSAPAQAVAAKAGNHRGAADALAAYRGKRDFSASPEPQGTAQRAGKPATVRPFCIQKHLASHLHYDFRLEHRGVLLSWAVPKGPSLDPAVKRLAVRVEDHPRDYGDFEGVIPSGYGAGIVVLWDRGLWQPDDPDVDAALAKGELKFTIVGEKLKGSWVLVRFQRAGPRNWMLIKHRDPWATSGDITEQKPESVNGSGDFADILKASGKNPWPDAAPVAGGETGALFADIIAEAYSAPAGKAHRR